MDGIDVNLAALKDRLAAQARELNGVFMRAVADMLRGKTLAFRDIGRALKAQNQCRTILRLLVKLDAAEQAAKKSQNRTNELMASGNRHQDQDLGQPLAESLLRPDQARTQELVAQKQKQKGRGECRRAPFGLPLDRPSEACPSARACSRPSSAHDPR